MTLLRRIWWRAAIAAVLAVFAWQFVCWWTGPVVAHSLRLSKTVAAQLLGFSRRGELIAAGVDPDDSRSVRVCLWDVPALTPNVVWRAPSSTPDDPPQFSLSGDGRWLNIFLGRSRVVLDLETHREFPHRKAGEVWISPDGRFLMNDDRLAGIEVSELQTGRVVGRIDDSWIHDISPNGEWVLASTADSCRVWRINEDKLIPTELKFDIQPELNSVIPMGPEENSGLAHQKSRISQFSPDSRRLSVFGTGICGIWQLDPPELRFSSQEYGIAGISTDGSRLFAHANRYLSTIDGKAHEPSRVSSDRHIQLGSLVDGKSLFLALQQSVWNVNPTMGFSIPIGPYELSLTPRDVESDMSYCLYDAVSGETMVLPRWMARTNASDAWVLDAPQPRAFLHPDRLALLSEDQTVCHVIPFPPSRPWLKQIAIWLLLTVPMCWLVIGRFRRKGDDDIFRPKPADRVAPAATSASH